MNELLKGKRQQWVYGLSIFSGISFVLKGQIAGDLILDILSSHFTAYFSDTLLLVLLGVVIWRRHHIRYLLIQRVGEKNYQFYQLVTVLVSVVCYFVAQFSLAVLFQLMNGQTFSKEMLLLCIFKMVYLICSGLIIYTISIGCNRNLAIIGSILFSLTSYFTIFYLLPV
jgi:hypothetical protein